MQTVDQVSLNTHTQMFFSTEITFTLLSWFSSCKAEGRRELQPGNAQADAVCGQHVPGKTLPATYHVKTRKKALKLCNNHFFYGEA